MYTLVERPDGYYELQFDGKTKSCPYQSLLFLPDPIDARRITAHKQPCCNDCSLMHIDFKTGEFMRLCENEQRIHEAEIQKQSTLTVIR